MPAVISSSLNSTAANHQAQVNKKTHTAEQGPDALFWIPNARIQEITPFTRRHDRRAHVACSRTRPPMLVPIPDTQIQEITPFTKRSRQTGTCLMPQNKAPDARSNTGYANTRDYALYKAEPTDGNMSHAAKQGSRCSFPADTELCEYKRLRPLQDGTTDGNMSHTTEPDILSYTPRILSEI